MKKQTAAWMLVFVLLLSSSVVLADNTASLPVTFCCKDDVYAIDFVFAVEGSGVITACTVAEKNCFYDWNFMKSEARLYFSLASAEPMKKHKTLAEFSAEGEVSVRPISVTINGNIADVSCLSHGEETDKPDIQPTYDTPGSKDGKLCSVCGATVKEPTVIPAIGPQVTATLSQNGVLSVSGMVSDRATTENHVMLGVYKGSRLLECVDISTQPQDNLNVMVENMQGATKVKIFRWSGLASMKPLYGAAEVKVKLLQ